MAASWLRRSNARHTFPVKREPDMPDQKPLRIDVVSDIVCPWCFIGKARLEKALALQPGVPVEVHYRPYFLNDWIPRDGISREEYLTTKFGSVGHYSQLAPAV